MNRTSLLTILAIASTLNATIPTNENVTKLYVATFNRAPDTNGLSYWVNDSNLDLEGISSSFFNQQETQDLYPKTTSNKDFISSVYQNLFNRVPDNDGWNYWENELNTGVIQRSQFIQAVVDGAKDTDNSNDKTILSNKTTVGLLFSNSNLNDKNQARDILIGVNQDTASVDYAQSSISDMQSSNISTNINLGSQNLPTLHILPRIFDEDGDDTNMKETYTLTANKDVNVTIQTPQGSWITPMWRYNNNPLPILIKTTRGNEMTLNFNNKLDSDSTIHWHGFKIPAEMDGGPDTPILPLQSKKYSFTMNQPAASMWFHPHPDMQTGKQVYMGLAGVYLLEDDISKSLEENNQLPSGDKDTVLLVQDRRFQGESTDTVRNLVYMNQRMDSIGMYGDTVLVNGSVLPKHEVSNTKFRYRLYNVSNARNYNFALSDGENFTIVGTDGGLLKNPVEVNHILLGPAERVDIIIDFSKYNVGNNIMLIDKSNGTSDKLNIMRFDITKYDTETITIYSELPNTAEISTRLNEADADNINNEYAQYYK